MKISCFKISTAILFCIVFINHNYSQINFQWAKIFNGIDDERVQSMVVDGSGNIYTAGSYFGPTDFDPGIGTVNSTAVGFTDVFVSKLDANGNYVWVKCMGGNSIEYNYGIALDPSGNVYFSGYFHDTVDFDPGPGVVNLISNGDSDIFICKLDNNGNFIWVKQLGGTGTDIVRNITTDASGNVYTTGFFTDTADFDPGANVHFLISGGNTDVFISKLDTNGDFVWAKKIGGTGHSETYQIKLDAAGNIYTTGYFRDTEDFDPSTSTSTLTSVGGNDAFVAKFDMNGNYLWAKQMGGSGYERGKKLTLDTSGNIFVVGNFDGPVDFDPGPGTFNLSSYGNDDIFILKLDGSGNFGWAKRIGGSNFEEPNDITIDTTGNLYMVGYFNDVVDFDPGIGTTNLTSVSTSADFYISKYDANGNMVWAKGVGGNGNDMANALVVDNTGTILVAGYFQHTVDFDPGLSINNITSTGSDDAFILKLVQVPAGIENFEKNISIEMYPNPNNGIFNIVCNEKINQIIITNTLGEIVWSTSNKQIDISKEAKGIYFITVQSGKGNYSTKMILK